MTINNSLAVIKPDGLPSNQNTNRYINAIVNGNPISNLETVARKKFLAECMAVAIFAGGWKQKDDDDITLMVNLLMSEINTRFKRMTELEIKAAFVNGAKGYYGKNEAGMCLPACIHWLDSYYLDSKRIEAKKQLEAEKDKNTREPIKSKLAVSDRRATIQLAYEKYLEKGLYHDYGNLIYDLLDAEGLIKFTTPEKKEFLERARKLIYARLQLCTNLQEKRENERKLQNLIESDTEPIAEAKRLALAGFFEGMKAKGASTIIFNLTPL